MSTSAIIAAKKRSEASLKKFEIPTQPTKENSCPNGVFSLSLLQSRLNWTSSVFPRYKSDAIQQPKKSTSSRRKWPNMILLGVGTLTLGPHEFDGTQFYKANRTLSNGEELIDIVFELNELPNERFVFPKDAILSLSVEDGPIVLHGSFLLPLDTTDEFELEKKRTVEELIEEAKNSIKETVFYPTNIRITKLDQIAIDALEDYVIHADGVKEIMKIKMSTIEKETKYIKYDLSEDPINNAEVQDLLKKATTVPDIITGPIMVEKKRNEILNAIQLGKRPRDAKFEADLPKLKYAKDVTKEDGLLKCAYCSTKYTTMWRPGPGGHGTLCNSCGIQWKEGKILKDAIVISPQEERNLIIERKEKEKAMEQVEIERVGSESKKIQKADPVVKKPTPPVTKKVKQTIPKPTPEPMEEVHTTPTTQQQQQQQQAFRLYSQGGIPLPTLSIDLGENALFSHPNCAVTLLDGHFHIRLSTETAEQCLINLEKKDLDNAEFNITKEGDPTSPREVLTMTLLPISRPIQLDQQTLDPTHAIKVRFLEKLDPSGGAVVKRILQRWLVTVPQVE